MREGLGLFNLAAIPEAWLMPETDLSTVVILLASCLGLLFFCFCWCSAFHRGCRASKALCGAACSSGNGRIRSERDGGIGRWGVRGFPE